MTQNLSENIIESSFNWHNDSIFPKGEYLYVPEDPIENLFYLKEGEVRQFSISPSGEEITIHIFKSPAVIPMMVVLSKSVNQFYFQAKTNCKCQSISSSDFLNQIQEKKEFLIDTVTRFAGAINGLSQRINTMASYKQKDQLLGILRYLALKQNPESNAEDKLKLNSISHSELAQWLGCARETVSRLLSSLVKEGLITKDKKNWFIKI